MLIYPHEWKPVWHHHAHPVPSSQLETDYCMGSSACSALVIFSPTRGNKGEESAFIFHFSIVVSPPNLAHEESIRFVCNPSSSVVIMFRPGHLYTTNALSSFFSPWAILGQCSHCFLAMWLEWGWLFSGLIAEVRIKKDIVFQWAGPTKQIQTAFYSSWGRL